MQFPETNKALLRLLSDGRFHSGQSLGTSLGLSRVAIWGLIKDLQGFGLEIHSVRGKGYRLAIPLELLDKTLIEAALPLAARRKLIAVELHDHLDSTNSHLMRLPDAEKTCGRACLTECQTAGRGRIGRAWQSPFGGNICLSLLWQFPDQGLIGGLSLAVGVAVVRAIRTLDVTDLGLKWPNDILWGGRKLGGILIEVFGEANGSYNVVIGVGLNLALSATQAERIDQPWVDLREILGDGPVPRNQLAGRLLGELIDVLSAYPANGLGRHIEEWRTYHCHQGKAARLQFGEQIIAGVVAGVSDEGLLLLDIAGEGRRAFASGDLSLRVADG